MPIPTKSPTTPPTPVITRELLGRDELNLAEFPISVLQHQQPRSLDGTKIRIAVYKSSRFDPAIKQFVPQTVTLSSEDGLPTPADEEVLLALLYLGKYGSNFSAPKVPFYLKQVIEVLRWPANKQHYDRLKGALRCLKALTIRYENSWWDAEGREYEAEFATGLIASYKIARITRGRKRGTEAPECWIEWHPDFLRSLQAGNLKTLNLEVLFGLRLPTARRMYRFLDKRFYNTPVFESDLFDFACGNIGLARTPKPAELKRRLAPAIAELEGIGFLKPAPAAERYRKVRGGFWRIRLEKGSSMPAGKGSTGNRAATTPAARLVCQWHRAWSGNQNHIPSAAELAFAQSLLEQHREGELLDILPALVDTLRQCFPKAQTFGAVRPYVGQVLDEEKRRKDAAEVRRAQARIHADRQRSAQTAQEARRAFYATWRPIWDQLPAAEQERLHAVVHARYPSFPKSLGLIEHECLVLLSQEKAAPSETPSVHETEDFANGAQQFTTTA